MINKDAKRTAQQSNQSAKFWLYETPEEVTTARNHFRYYKEAGRLTVSLPNYHDRETGEERPGKGVSINLNALAEEPETLQRLIEILESLKD